MLITHAVARERIIRRFGVTTVMFDLEPGVDACLVADPLGNSNTPWARLVELNIKTITVNLEVITPLEYRPFRCDCVVSAEIEYND